MKRNHWYTAVGLLLFFLLCLVPSGQAQNATPISQSPGTPWQLGLSWTFTSTSAPTGAFSVKGLSYYRILFVPSGTVSGCSISFDSSPTGGSFVTGGIIAAGTIGSCAGAGSYITTTAAGISNFGQLTPTITGSGNVTVAILGYTDNPSAGGGSASNITAPVDGSGYVEVNCKTGCSAGTPGQQAMAGSQPVVIASNQSAVPASQSGTWNVRGQDGSGNALTSNSTTYTAKFGLDNNLLGTLGTAFTTPGFVDVKGADGNIFVRQATAANLNATVVQSGTWNVRAQDGSGNALTSNSTTYTAKFGLDANLLGTLGTAFTTPGFVDVKGADGNIFVRQTSGSNLHVNVDNNQTSASGALTNASSSTCTGSGVGGNGVTVATSGAATVGINVTGSNTATIGFYYSIDGTNYQAVPSNMVFPEAGGTGVTTFSANGRWFALVGSAADFMICGPAQSGGTATINLQASLAPRLLTDNIGQFGGTAVQTGTGAGGAGIPRVTVSSDSSLAAHQSTNVDQINGTAPTEKAASTQSVAADTSLVMQINPNQPNLTTPLNVGAAQTGTWNVRGQDGAGNALTSNSTTYTSKFALDVNLLGADGTAFGTAGVLDDNVKNVGGNAVSTVANGVAKVGVADSAGNAITSNNTTQSRSIDVNVVSTLGATNAKTNPLNVNLADGTNFLAGAFSAIGVAPAGTTILGVNAALLPETTAGTAATPSSQSALTTAVVVKAGVGNVYGFQVTNGAASVCYLQFINVASGPVLGTTAVYSFAVPASSTLTLPPGSFALSHFSTGISVGMSTAYNGSSACGTAATAVIFYQ